MPLYEQVGRNIYLTEVGEQVASSCRAVIGKLSNLEILLDDYKGMKRGRLKVSVVSTAKYFAPRALGTFCKQHPNIELGLKITNRDTILKRIDQNLDDLYILGQVAPIDLDLKVIPFAPNPLVIVAHRDHELAGKKVTLKRLAKEQFLLREDGSGIRSALQSLFKERGLELNERLTLETNEAIKHCVAGDLGVACVSEHGLKLDSPTMPIVKLDVEGFPINKQWNIVYPAGKELSVIAQEFLEYLQEYGLDFIDLKEQV
jgi:DNA-binding transcriptional LysR family regulator